MRNRTRHALVGGPARRLMALGAGPAVILAVLLTVPAGAQVSTGAAADLAAQSGAGYDYAAQDLRAEVWLDRAGDDVYRRGDRQQVYFETNADAYAVVYRIDAEGRVEVLWPRSRLDDGFVFGHHEYRLPVGGARELQVSGAEGMGYVQIVASRYPFDLRTLELDFFHEPREPRQDFYVAGDPFLAMNEVNFVVTGLEDAADFVITNYASYYVHRMVDYPRYLCSQCHIGDEMAAVHDPYGASCTVEIHHDYGWPNEWYVTYGYYPVYYHPVYYYVDPWTYRPWINYWYRPWYAWPTVPVYSWHFTPWGWWDSPYWYGDVYAHYGRYRDSGTRYRPLDKDWLRRGLDKDRGRMPLVRERPDDRVVTAMRERVRLNDARGEARGQLRDDRGRGADRYVDRSELKRERRDFERADRGADRGGLRIVDRSARASGFRHGSSERPLTGQEVRVRTLDRGRSGTERLEGRVQERPVRGESGRTIGPRDGAGDARMRDRSLQGREIGRDREIGPDRRTREEYRAGAQEDRSRVIRPVEPRNRGTRVWSGRTRSGGDRPDSPAQVRPSPRSRDTGREAPAVNRQAPRRETRPDTKVERPSRPTTRSSGDRSRVQGRSSSGGSRSSGSSTPQSRGGSGSSGGRTRGGRTP